MGVFTQIEDLRLDPMYSRERALELDWRKKLCKSTAVDGGVHATMWPKGLVDFGTFRSSTAVQFQELGMKLKRLHWLAYSPALNWLQNCRMRPQPLLLCLTDSLSNLTHLETDMISLFGNPYHAFYSWWKLSFVTLLPSSLKVLRVSEVWHL